MYYTNEFKTLVWLLILSGYLACVFILFIILRLHHLEPSSVFHNVTYVALYIFSFHLGIPASPRINFTRVRIFIGMMLFYSLIINSAYQSTLGSFLTVPWKREQIKTFHEIIEGNYHVCGQPQANRILQRSSKNSATLEVLSDRFQTHRDHFSPLLARIHQKKDTVTFAAQRW